MTTLAGPVANRLRKEVVRIVSIPYSTAFTHDRDRLNLASSASIGMGTDVIAKKRTVKMRLERENVGIWQCPRLSNGHKGLRIHVLPRDQAPRSPGYCEIKDEASPGGLCGRKLRVEETHRHEMAEAFGFLESQGDSYVIGKFGHVGKFLEEVTSKPFNDQRARLALYLIALLEHHADFVLPVLWTLNKPSTYGANWSDEVLRIFRANLVLKGSSCSREHLNRAHPAVLLIRQIIEAKLEAFGVASGGGLRSIRQQSAKKRLSPLSPNVQSAYATRARTYLIELGAIREVSSPKRIYELTSFGSQLVSAIQRQGIMMNEATCQLPPSFEAIHDVLSISMDQYLGSFSPPVTDQIIERVIMKALLPDIEPFAWVRYRSELEGLLPRIIRSVGSKINDGARIDTVRLAAFLFQIGKGIPMLMEDQDVSLDNADLRIRSNAIVDIAAANPDRYILGSPRVGRRLWSIHYLRSGHYPC